MIDTNRIEVDINNIANLVSDYIQKNFSPIVSEEISSPLTKEEMIFPVPQGIIGGLHRSNVDSFNFLNLFKKNEEETFSKMLLRLIEESGEKNSTIYTRANIDRRHFSKIVNHDDYQLSKLTVLAFDKTKALLASAGFTLTNSNLADVIVSAFIENKIFDVDLVNQILYKYDQPLLSD